MKRDLDLIRGILLAVENSVATPAFDTIETLTKHLKFKDLELVSYHIELLKDCDYIETSSPFFGSGYADYTVIRMTSLGCDYLDNVRNDTVWNETQNKLKAYGGSLALDIVKSLAGTIIREKLGLF